MNVGSLVNVSDGTVAQRMDYDEFGNVLLDSNPGFQPFGFQGGLYDRDTGLVRFGARDYDPRIGRWLTKDALGFEAGINFYVFCGNDPVNQVDSSGLCEDGNNWDEMEWWEKLGAGYYYGTGYGQDAQAWYMDQIVNNGKPWYQEMNLWAGGFMAGLWTPSTYQDTGWALISAYGLRNAGTPWQLRDGSSARTVVDYGNIIRVERHMIGSGAERGMKWHVDALNGLIRHWPH